MASGAWSEIVPWQKDVAAALKAAREQAFREQRYAWPFDDEPRPDSLEALEQTLDETGFGSVLDAFRTGRKSDLGVAGPVSTATLKRVFGTPTPTVALFRERELELLAELDRGACAWLALFDDDEPKHLCFVGSSVDAFAFEDGAEIDASNSEYLRKRRPSKALAAVVGEAPLGRADAVASVFDYARAHGLLVGTRIALDATLRAFVGSQDDADVFDLTNAVNNHLEEAE